MNEPCLNIGCNHQSDGRCTNLVACSGSDCPDTWDGPVEGEACPECGAAPFVACDDDCPRMVRVLKHAAVGMTEEAVVSELREGSASHGGEPRGEGEARPLNSDQMSGCACVVCGRGDRPLVPIMVETEWSTMLFHCDAPECACSDEQARAMVEATQRVDEDLQPAIERGTQAWDGVAIGSLGDVEAHTSTERR